MRETSKWEWRVWRQKSWVHSIIRLDERPLAWSITPATSFSAQVWPVRGDWRFIPNSFETSSCKYSWGWGVFICPLSGRDKDGRAVQEAWCSQLARKCGFAARLPYWAWLQLGTNDCFICSVLQVISLFRFGAEIGVPNWFADKSI